MRDLPYLLIAIFCTFALPALPAAAEEAAAAPTAAPETAPAEAPAEVAADEATDEASPRLAMADRGSAGGGSPFVAGSNSVEAEVVADAEEGSKPWSVNVGVGTSMSMMLFSPTRYVRSSNATFVPSVSVGGSYKLMDKVMAMGSWGASYELTQPNNTSGRRFSWGDPNFALTHGSLFKDDDLTGINISGSASLGLGLSLYSLTSSQLFSLGGSVAASRSFLDDRLGASLSLTGGLPFHRYDSPTVRQTTRDGVLMCLVRDRGAEAVSDSQCATGSSNGVGSLGVTLGLSYKFTDKLGGSLNFGLNHSYSYKIPVDEFSSQIVDSKGNLVVDGTRGSDSMMAGLGLNYSFAKGYSLTANLSTGGALFRYMDPDLTQENRELRFPFWDSSLMRTNFSMRLSRSF